MQSPNVQPPESFTPEQIESLKRAYMRIIESARRRERQATEQDETAKCGT